MLACTAWRRIVPAQACPHQYPRGGSVGSRARWTAPPWRRNSSGNADIARQLHLSEGTVRNYVSAVLAKLGVSDRAQAAIMALRYGLVDLGDI